MQLQNNSGTDASILIKDSRNIVIKESVVNGKRAHMVKKVGKNNSGIKLLNNIPGK